METSKYNIYHKVEDGMYIMNLVSEAIIKLNKENAKKFTNRDFESFNREELDFLLDRYIVTKRKDDDIKVLMLRYGNAKYSDNSIYCTLIPTYECNFSCEYCYQDVIVNKSNKLVNVNVNEWFDNLLIFFQGETINKDHLHIEWFGGEPTIFSDQIIEFNHKIREICKYNECSFTCSMVSNGYLLDKKTYDRLHMSGLTNYLITIDGLQETHNQRRYLKDGSGSFDKIIENVAYMSNTANLKLRINVDSNNENEVIDLIKYLDDKIENKDNVQIIIAPVYNFTDNDLERYIKVLSDIYRNIKGYNFRFNLIDYLFKKEICMASYKSHYSIDIYGHIYKCISLAGNSNFRDGIIDFEKMEIEYNDRMLDFITFNPMFNNTCKECIYLPICVGGCIIQKNQMYSNKLVNSSCITHTNCRLKYDKLVNQVFLTIEE